MTSNVSSSEKASELGDEDVDEMIRQMLDMEKGSGDSKEKEKKQRRGFDAIVEEQKASAELEWKKFEELKKIRWTMAQTVKCGQLKIFFPSLQAGLVEDVFLQHELNFDAALGWLKSTYPSKFQKETPKPILKKTPTSQNKPTGDSWSYDPDVIANMSVS